MRFVLLSELDCWNDEGAKNILDSRRVRRSGCLGRVKSFHAGFVDNGDPARQHSLQQRFFGLEVIVNRSQIDFCGFYNRADAGALEPMIRK